MTPINRYDEVFQIEVEGWCYGLMKYPGEMSPAIVHRIIRELAMSFEAAIEHHVVFSILGLARQISQAVEGIVSERDVAFSILGQLPNPGRVSEEGRFVLAQIVDEVEREYGGVIARLERKWKPTRRAAA
jgi:hypothetical protein